MSAGDLAARDALIEAALAHVPFDGWSSAALNAGARDLNLAGGAVADLFPGGVAQAIRHFSR